MFDGNYTGSVFSGLNSIYRALSLSPISDMLWSIPPQAVPSCLSHTINLSTNENLSIEGDWLLAKRLIIPLQTTKEELDDRPAAIGTFPDTSTFIPTKVLVSPTAAL